MNGIDIPTIDDLLVCSNCGWSGHNSEFHILGIDADIIDEFVAGECTLECPECRVDPGPKLNRGNKVGEIIRFVENLEITVSGNEYLGTHTEQYFAGKYRPHNPVRASTPLAGPIQMLSRSRGGSFQVGVAVEPRL